MAGTTSFPTAIDTNVNLNENYTDGASGDDVVAAIVNNLAAAVKALETKVGINSSTVNTTFDYLRNTVLVQSGLNISPAGTVTLTSANFAAPVTQAFGDSAAAGAATTFARSDHRHGMPTQTAQVFPKYKYKTAGQNFTTTTLTNVTATTGDIAFALAATSAYRLDIDMYITAVGTAGGGGFKWALSGITAPTAFLGTLYVTASLADSVSAMVSPQNSPLINPGGLGMSALTMGTAFGGLSSTNNTTAAGLSSGLYKITAFILTNTSGTVTFQAAQNTAGGTSTIASAVATLTKLEAE